MKVLKNILIVLIFISCSINLPISKKHLLFKKYEIESKNTVEATFLKIPIKHSATWYSLPGNKTFTGENFNKDSLTAAYNFRKMGTILKVTNLNNNKFVIVRVNDKMGNKSKNIIDLSHGAFKKIASLNKGRIDVKIEELKKV